MPPPNTPPRDGAVVLRTAHADDEAALVRLAALDSAHPLTGPALVAEENGAIVAALCLSTGRAVADPFVPSLHLVELLRRRPVATRRQPPRSAAAGCCPASRCGWAEPDRPEAVVVTTDVKLLAPDEASDEALIDELVRDRLRSWYARLGYRMIRSVPFEQVPAPPASQLAAPCEFHVFRKQLSEAPRRRA